VGRAVFVRIRRPNLGRRLFFEGITVKKLLLTAALLLPAPAMANTLDVISSHLKPGCTFGTYMGITKEFNDSWGKAHGYNAQLMLPVHSSDSSLVIWVGNTASAEAFGKAWDVWRTALANPNSVEAKLQARFDACATQMSRASYDTY
jgi:hypothetical protein